MRRPRSQIALRDVYRALFRHKSKALLFFLMVMGAVVLVTMLQPRVYRSESILYLRLGRENVALDPTVTLSPETVVAIPQSRENELNSVAEILRSRVFLEEVVDAVGPEKILGPQAAKEADVLPGSQFAAVNGQRRGEVTQPTNGAAKWWQTLTPGTVMTARERAVLQVTEQLGVEPMRRSDLILVTYNGWSPEVAQTVVRRLVDAYLRQHVQLNRTGGAYEFLTEETARIRSRLAEAEQKLLELRNQTGLSSPVDQQELLLKRIGRLEDELLQTKAAAAVSAVKIGRLRDQLARLPTTQVTGSTSGVANEGTDAMRAQFYSLRLQEMAAASKYTDEHPLLKEVRRQTTEAKKSLDQEETTRTEVTTGPDRAYEQTQLALIHEEPMLASLQTQAEQLETQLASAREELRTLNKNEFRIASLRREVELDEASYRKYAANLEQARIDQELERQRISNIKLVQPATYEVKPIRPRPFWNLILGLMVGSLGGLGLALTAEYMDHSFQTPEDVEERLELPMLVSIPRLKRRQLIFHGKNGF